MLLILFILRNFFINLTEHIFFFLKKTKTAFQNSIPKHNFFSYKNTKKLLLKTIFQNSF